MITLEARALGRKTPLSPQWSIPAPPVDANEPLTLRALISSIVRDEVRAFSQRQEQRRLLNVLTAKQIQEAAARGKVDMGGRSEDEVSPVDEEAAVATALQAFDDGLYLAIIDGTEYRELDAPVRIGADSRMTFLRLTMLAGG
jgi:hypothetical protein